MLVMDLPVFLLVAMVRGGTAATAPTIATTTVQLRSLVDTAPTDGTIVDVQLVPGVRYELGGTPLTVAPGAIVRVEGGGIPHPVLDAQHLSRCWLVQGRLEVNGVDLTGGMVCPHTKRARPRCFLPPPPRPKPHMPLTHALAPPRSRPPGAHQRLNSSRRRHFVCERHGE